MTRTAVEIEGLIKAAKDQKKLIKGNVGEEAKIAVALRELMAELNLVKPPAESNSAAFNLKVPKGTRDFNDNEMALRMKMFRHITNVFQKHGAVTIDTPIFELTEILCGKYGEDSKLIYNLQDQGGEDCSLRYDLTVPFARFLAMNRDYQNFKRFHIGKVYRRDNPSIAKGRMREFFQCDFDIAGTYDAMIPDAEAIKVMVEILQCLPIGPFKIKLNHRKLLDGMFQICGVPEDKLRQISSAVDKLDKATWEEVKVNLLMIQNEMVNEKKLDPIVADRIGEYVKNKGGKDLCEKLLLDLSLTASADAVRGIKDVQLLFQYLELFGVADKVSFDLSLARGLDYYTGVIYEAVLLSAEDSNTGIGSVAAGGRYDNLVGMFSGGKQIPCVGISIGVERIFAILSRKNTIKSCTTSVFVCAIDGLLVERMQLCNELWGAGINAEFTFKAAPKLQKQLQQCEKLSVPIAVIIGPNEILQEIVKVKILATQVEVIVPRKEMVAYIQKLLVEIATLEEW